MTLFNSILSHNLYLHSSLMKISHYLSYFQTLESNSILSPIQYDFCKGLNTLQSSTDLQLQINETFQSNSVLFSIFFDLPEAFPRIWRYLICQRLNNIGLTDNLHKIFQNSIHICANPKSSILAPCDPKCSPSRWSIQHCTIFLLAIANIDHRVRFPITQQFLLSTIVSASNHLIPFLQLTLNKISSWAFERGFHPPKKTRIVTSQKNCPPPLSLPPLFLQGFKIKYQNSATFFGIHFDQKSTRNHNLTIFLKTNVSVQSIFLNTCHI